MTSGKEGGPNRSQPLRRDAERNRQRILAAAAEVFTQRGLEVSLDEVARHAGVGVGTVYRRFADKEELVRTLFTERIDKLAAIAERALEMPDPWEALVSFLDEWVSALAGDVGLRDLLMFATYAQDRASYARHTFAPLVTALVDRAKASGHVRADLCPTDIPFIVLMLSAAAEYAHESRPEIWRRYLTLFIDGMHASRDTITPLPVPALVPQEMERTMVQHARRRR
ncbi:MAG TPA: TetR/AcrR family transcriptional regulator [Streptosporangiaceae bacterium]